MEDLEHVVMGMLLAAVGAVPWGHVVRFRHIAPEPRDSALVGTHERWAQKAMGRPRVTVAVGGATMSMSAQAGPSAVRLRRTAAPRSCG